MIPYTLRDFFYAWMLEQSKNLRLNENEMGWYMMHYIYASWDKRGIVCRDVSELLML